MPADESVDLMLHIAQASINFQQQIVDAITQYKATGIMPNDLLAGLGNGGASPKKRGKKSKLNKDGTEKQPRKPTAYNAWMQAKLKELKEAADHDPEQKHVETFKQAANIWATLPKEEKDRITAEYKEKDKNDEAAAGVQAAHAAVAAHMAGEASSDEEDEAPVKVEAQDSSSEESSDEEEAPAPAPKPAPKPTPPPAPVLTSPATDGKKKKKRKPAEEPAAVPAKAELAAPAVDADKRKKKKKKKDV